ncbi:MAG: glycosyltransferase [Pseudomonadota bacterium]
MSRLVIATHRRLDTEKSGSKTYLKRLVDLAETRGFEVAFVCVPEATFSNRPWATIDPAFAVGRAIAWPGAFKSGDAWISLSPKVWSRFIWRLFQEVFIRLRLGPESWRRPWANLSTPPTSRDLHRTAKAVTALKPDIVVVEYSAMGPLLPRLPKSIGTALLVHDSFAARAELFEARGERLDSAERPDFATEAARFNMADVVLHASVNELERFSELASCAEHLWFRPTAPVRRDALRRLDAPRLVYIGADQQGSRDAITHFLADLWPGIRNATPSTRLEIIGPVGATLDKSLLTDGVDVLGRVDDLADYGGPDRIGLAPTRLASGISIKIGEYLGLGLPIVAYRTGVDGYGSTLDGILNPTETPNEFVEETLRLVNDRDLRRTRAEAGLDLAETLLSNDDVANRLVQLAQTV